MKLLTQKELDNLPTNEQKLYYDWLFNNKKEAATNKIDDYPRKNVNPIPPGML